MNPASIILSIIGFIMSLVKGKQNEKPIESAPDSVFASFADGVMESLP